MVTKTYTTNAAWMLLEKLARMVLSFVLLGLILRQIGPQGYGVISLAIAVVSILWAISNLGLDSILIREFSSLDVAPDALFSTVFILRWVVGGAGVAVAVLLLFSSWCHGCTWAEHGVGLILLPSLFFYNVNTYYSFYIARSDSRFTTLVSLLGLAVSSAVKLWLIAVHASLEAFAAAFAFDVAAPLILIALIPKRGKPRVRLASFRWGLIRRLSSQALPMLASSLLIIVYMRVDQLMIARMMGMRDVGLYSLAVRISETYVLVPTMLASSFYPMITKDRSAATIRRYFDIVFFAAVMTGAVVVLLAPYVIPALFGAVYAESIPAMRVSILATAFAVLGGACTNFLILQNLAYMRLVRACLGLVVNVVLNLYWIPEYGIMGAACATLVGQLFGAWLGNFFSRKAQFCFRTQTMTILTLGIPGAISTLRQLMDERRAGRAGV